jgi:hypothetical protein
MMMVDGPGQIFNVIQVPEMTNKTNFYSFYSDKIKELCIRGDKMAPNKK